MSTGTTTLTDRKTSAWLWPALFSLVAFAANSVFCRLALKDGAIDPVSFTMVRLASGALFLLLLIRLRSPVHTMGGSWWAAWPCSCTRSCFLRRTCNWGQGWGRCCCSVPCRSLCSASRGTGANTSRYACCWAC